jgi:hypothetical protein
LALGFIGFKDIATRPPGKEPKVAGRTGIMAYPCGVELADGRDINFAEHFEIKASSGS